MEFVTVILSFIIGFLLILAVCFAFSVKTKGVFRLLLNTVIGGIVLVLFGFFNVFFIAINPLNAFIVGLLGLPGLIAIIIITLFL